MREYSIVFSYSLTLTVWMLDLNNHFSVFSTVQVSFDWKQTTVEKFPNDNINHRLTHFIMLYIIYIVTLHKKYSCLFLRQTNPNTNTYFAAAVPRRSPTVVSSWPWLKENLLQTSTQKTSHICYNFRGIICGYIMKVSESTSVLTCTTASDFIT